MHITYVNNKYSSTQTLNMNSESQNKTNFPLEVCLQTLHSSDINFLIFRNVEINH